MRLVHDLGSARVSRVGFGVSPKQSYKSSRRRGHRRPHARRVRYPDNSFVPITRQPSTPRRSRMGTTQRTAATESKVTALNGNLITAASSFFIRAGSFL